MEELIKSGNELLIESNFNKGRMKVWQIRCERVLTELYDAEIAKEFHKVFSSGMVIRAGMTETSFFNEIYKPRIIKGVEFLVSLQESVMPKIIAENPHPINPQTITVQNGTVILGNHNTVTSVTLKNVLEALEKDIETKIPPGKERSAAITALKNLTSNETVAAVIGQTLGAFLSHAIK